MVDVTPWQFDRVVGRSVEAVIDELWKPRAAEQLSRRKLGEPLGHKLVRLPHVSKRSRRLMGPLDGLLVDG